MNKESKIYIVGAGAIGKALAVFLKNNGRDVVLLRGSIEVVSNHVEEITVEISNHTEIKARIEISSVDNFDSLDGIVVLTTKSYGNHQLAAKLQKKLNSSPLVILQNGLNIEAPFIEAGIKNILRCVLFTSSQLINSNLVSFKPIRPSQIGVISGGSNCLQAVAEALNTSYFEFQMNENIQPVLWTKVIANIVFNSVCPLLETDNGIFHRNLNAFNIAKRIIDSCIFIARKSGINLETEEVIKTLLTISKSSDGQLISTYQDLNNKRKTEIDSMNFALAAIASGMEMEELVKEVKLLGELITIKSELSLNT